MVGKASRHIIAAAIVPLLLLYRGAAAQQAAIPWKIDERTAQRLAAEGWDQGKLPGVLDYDPGMGRPFFVFYGISTLPGSQGGFGYFAVNPWTGDVWALWGCRKLSSRALRRSKAEIRRRFTREELKEYPRLSRLKPECI